SCTGGTMRAVCVLQNLVVAALSRSRPRMKKGETTGGNAVVIREGGRAGCPALTYCLCFSQTSELTHPTQKPDNRRVGRIRHLEREKVPGVGQDFDPRPGDLARQQRGIARR